MTLSASRRQAALSTHSLLFPDAFALAHLFLAIAASFALAAALIRRFGLAAFTPLTLAQRAFWAAAILRRAAADIFRRVLGARDTDIPSPASQMPLSVLREVNRHAIIRSSPRFHAFC